MQPTLEESSKENQRMNKDNETHKQKQKKREVKSKTKEETKGEEATTNKELESSISNRKYDYKKKDLMPLTEVSNFTMDDYVNCLMMKHTNDMKTISKHKKNSKHFENIKKRNFRLLNRVKESFIAWGSQLSNGIVVGKKPITELDFYLQNEIKKRNIVQARSILIPWLLSEIDHWILL